MRAIFSILVSTFVLAAVAILWNLGLIYWLFVPGGSGEWTRLAVPLAWIFGSPLALLALAAAFLAPQYSPRSGRAARTVSILALAMPLLVTLLSRLRS